MREDREQWDATCKLLAELFEGDEFVCFRRDADGPGLHLYLDPLSTAREREEMMAKVKRMIIAKNL